jgi:hypothetical protein
LLERAKRMDVPLHPSLYEMVVPMLQQAGPQWEQRARVLDEEVCGCIAGC